MLDVVDWRITSQCNCMCEFCYASENRDVLSHDNMMKVADKICSLGVKAVCLSGGEPLLCDALPQIIKHFNTHGVKVFLSTNGYFYLDKIDEIEPYISKLSLPLDGYDPISNSCGGRPLDAFDKVKEILDYYTSVEHNLYIKISTVLVKENCNKEHLEKIKSFLQNYKIAQWKIYELIPEGRGAENYSKLAVNYAEFTTDFLKGSLDCDFKISYIPEHIRNLAYFIILPDGDVMIPGRTEHGYDECTLGNILADSIQELKMNWTEAADHDNYLKNLNFRQCEE